jgi:serine/threonine-protein kinase
VDGKGNVYAAGTGGVWELKAGKNSPTRLSFGALRGPAGVAVDIQGTVYVTDGAGHGRSRVLALPARLTTPVVLPFTQLDRPTGVAVDPAGNVYVVDSGNDRVVEMPRENIPFR